MQRALSPAKTSSKCRAWKRKYLHILVNPSYESSVTHTHTHMQTFSSINLIESEISLRLLCMTAEHAYSMLSGEVEREESTRYIDIANMTRLALTQFVCSETILALVLCPLGRL